LSFLFSLGERWQKQGRKDGDDRDDHQKFNQGKCRTLLWVAVPP
jgi:hypothetical protein